MRRAAILALLVLAMGVAKMAAAQLEKFQAELADARTKIAVELSCEVGKLIQFEIPAGKSARIDCGTTDSGLSELIFGWDGQILRIFPVQSSGQWNLMSTRPNGMWRTSGPGRLPNVWISYCSAVLDGATIVLLRISTDPAIGQALAKRRGVWDATLNGALYEHFVESVQREKVATGGDGNSLLVNAEMQASRVKMILQVLPPAADGATPLLGDSLPPAMQQFVCTSSYSATSDKKNCVFLATREDGSNDVYLYSVEDGSLVNLTQNIEPRGKQLSGPVLGPDGHTILVTGFPYSGIWAVDITSSERRLLIDNNSAVALCWSADGRYVAYTVAELNQEKEASTARIEVFDLMEAKVARTIADAEGKELVEPSFSPDGEYLAYVRLDGNIASPVGTLVIRSLKTDQENVIAIPGRNIHTPAFTSDGRQVAYRSGDAMFAEIYLYSIADKTERQVTKGTGWHPQWLADSDGILFESLRGNGKLRPFCVTVGKEKPPGPVGQQ